jgi:hypothetical protein
VEEGGEGGGSEGCPWQRLSSWLLASLRQTALLQLRLPLPLLRCPHSVSHSSSLALIHGHPRADLHLCVCVSLTHKRTYTHSLSQWTHVRAMYVLKGWMNSMKSKVPWMNTPGNNDCTQRRKVNWRRRGGGAQQASGRRPECEEW